MMLIYLLYPFNTIRYLKNKVNLLSGNRSILQNGPYFRTPLYLVSATILGKRSIQTGSLGNYKMWDKYGVREPPLNLLKKKS